MVLTEPGWSRAVARSGGRAASTADDTTRTMAGYGRTGAPLPMVSCLSSSVLPAQIARARTPPPASGRRRLRAVRDAEPTEKITPVQTSPKIRPGLSGGMFSATVPTGGPLPPRDWLRYARLCLALRHRGHPNDGPLADARSVHASAGLLLVSDETRAFACSIRTGDVADRFLDSLYPPEVDPARIDGGRQVARRWVGSTITVPIRRIVATTL